MKKLTRREVVMGLGAAGAGLAWPAHSIGKRRVQAILPDPYPTCVLTPEQTEGPYYFETNLIRRDITEDRPGEPLILKLKVVDAASCEPIQDAVVDIWSCDALGEYSGYETVNRTPGRPRGRNAPPPPERADNGRPAFHQVPVNEKIFLRGAQVTDSEGMVEFKTIYPGWYPGRATHIHFKVYLENDALLTSQVYFPEEMNDAVYQMDVYREHEGKRMKNTEDGIFNRAGKGPMLTLARLDTGFVGTMTFGVDRS